MTPDNPPTPNGHRHLLTGGLVTLCLLLLVSNVVILRRAQKIESVYQAMRHLSLEVKAGSRVPPLEGFDVAGRWAHIGFEQQKPLVVFVFSPRCAFSDRDWSNWAGLAPAVERTARAVYVDVSKTADATYLSKHATGDAPVIVKPDAKAITSYNLSLTPQTILVDPSGTVQKVWSGVLAESDVADIRNNLEPEAGVKTW